MTKEGELNAYFADCAEAAYEAERKSNLFGGEPLERRRRVTTLYTDEQLAAEDMAWEGGIPTPEKEERESEEKKREEV